MRLLRRRPKLDRTVYTHTYTGPETSWGLRPNTPCRILEKRAGGRRILTPDGKVWTVGLGHLQKHA